MGGIGGGVKAQRNMFLLLKDLITDKGLFIYLMIQGGGGGVSQYITLYHGEGGMVINQYITLYKERRGLNNFKYLF